MIVPCILQILLQHRSCILALTAWIHQRSVCTLLCNSIPVLQGTDSVQCRSTCIQIGTVTCINIQISSVHAHMIQPMIPREIRQLQLRQIDRVCTSGHCFFLQYRRNLLCCHHGHRPAGSVWVLITHCRKVRGIYTPIRSRQCLFRQ